MVDGQLRTKAARVAETLGRAQLDRDETELGLRALSLAWTGVMSTFAVDFQILGRALSVNKAQVLADACTVIDLPNQNRRTCMCEKICFAAVVDSMRR